ncbi:MAG: hypothetical protein FJ104_12235, partial [Deltaproteobacteria bacterium]|nr:hypothetical protein [Deltaproteobacteria bacterium]
MSKSSKGSRALGLVRAGALTAWPVLVACSAGDVARDEATELPAPGDSPVAEPEETPPGLTRLGSIQGEFDGKAFHLTRIEPVAPELEGLLRATALDLLPSERQQTGQSGTTPDTISLEQQEIAYRGNSASNGTWPATGCGTEIVPSAGANGVAVCVRIKARNLHTDFDANRSYVVFSSLTGKSGSTGVNIAPVSATTDTSVEEFGLSPTVPNGLFRYGFLGFNAPTGNGPDRWWLFRGTSSGNLGFNFVAQVYGKLQRPTVRANLADGSEDAAPYYTADGTPGAMADGVLDMSADGVHVVFASAATNLHLDTAGGGQHIYRKDLLTTEVDVIDRPSDGSAPPTTCTSRNPSISNDGRFVAFESDCNLVVGATYPQAWQVYLRDVSQGTTALVSHSAEQVGIGADAAASAPRVAGGGGYVVFVTAATNVVAAGANRPNPRASTDAYRYDVASLGNVRANVPNGQPAGVTNPAATWPNGAQSNPDISDDGSLVVFDTSARNLVSPSLASTARKVFLYQMASSLTAGTGSTYLLSKRSTGANPGTGTICQVPSLSGDGSRATFRCTVGSADPAMVGAPATTATRAHLYVRDTPDGSAGSLRMVDVSPNGAAEGNANVGDSLAYFSPSARFVGFTSTAGNLLRTTGCQPACFTGAADPQAYVYDLEATDPTLNRAHAVSLVRRVTAGTPNLVRRV